MCFWFNWIFIITKCFRLFVKWMSTLDLSSDENFCCCPPFYDVVYRWIAFWWYSLEIKRYLQAFLFIEIGILSSKNFPAFIWHNELILRARYKYKYKYKQTKSKEEKKSKCGWCCCCCWNNCYCNGAEISNWSKNNLCLFFHHHSFMHARTHTLIECNAHYEAVAKQTSWHWNIFTGT